MSARLLGILVVVVAFSFEARAAGPKPVECIRSKTVPNSGQTQTTAQACGDFDLSYPKSYNGVCVFKSGSWQFGNLTWDAAKKKHVFVSKFSCDAGVHVAPEQTTLDIASPSVGDYFEGKKDKVDLAGSVYVSKLTASPLAAKEVPVACYQRERNGVPVDALACEAMPNDAGYCEFRDVGKGLSYRGNWFVRYARAGRKGMVVCAGGVKFSKLSDAADEYGEKPKQVVVKSMSIGEFNALLSKPEIDGTNEIAVQMATCVYKDKKDVTVVCKNQASGGFDDWVSDPKKFEANARIAASLPHDKRLAELRRLIARKPAAAVLATLKAEQMAILDQIEDAVTKAMDDAATAYMGKHPVDNTILAVGECGIEWNPKDSKVTGPYVMAKVGSKLIKKACASIEAVQVQ